ncbi:hypothetical protein AAHB33_03325 [Paenarthrobacter sp. S56]|uniref:hypothetical protein n=1 Tax=Paenarthrobacter sp. S56 TaxID=3138179 RepID=UPI00321BBBC7
MALDEEISQAESAVREQEDALRAMIPPFATAMAGELASYVMTEVRGVVIDKYNATVKIGAAGVSKLRSEVEAVVAAFSEQALQLYSQGDPMIYPVSPRQDVWPSWAMAIGERDGGSPARHKSVDALKAKKKMAAAARAWDAS